MRTTSTIVPVRNDSAPLTVADAIISSLGRWGVEAIYGVSGANIEHLHDAIHRQPHQSVRSVAARSESGAAFMADAHARVHGTLGVCCATSGGGMMNLAVGIAESYQEGIPVLAIVGQVARGQEGIGGFQDSSGQCHTVNAEALWRSISKEVRVVRSADTLWQDLLGAVRACLTGRKGPATLLIPRDVFAEEVPPCPTSWPNTLQGFGPNRAPSITRLHDALIRAKRPLLVAGSRVRNTRDPESLTAFAERTQIPVVSTLSDIGAFPNEHPLYLGTIGTAGHPSAHRYIQEEADLVIVAGSSLEMMLSQPIREALQGMPVAFVDEDVSRVRSAFPQAIAVQGEIGAVFQGILDRRPRQFPGIPAGYEIERTLPRLAEPPPDEADAWKEAEGTLLQSEALSMIQGVLPEYQHLLFDAGNCSASALHYLKIPKGCTTDIALGMGGMGYAIPAAVGAQLGDPREDSRTMVLCGDGAFLLLGMEVHTAVDMGLPIVFVVFNNGKHGMCVTRQQVYFDGRLECSRYPSASIAQIARGFGDGDQIWVGSAGTTAELSASLESLKDWGTKGPAVLELVLRREEIPPFTPFANPKKDKQETPARVETRTACAA